MNSIAPLVTELIKRQGTQTDLDFAKSLGLLLETWRSIKKGHRNLGSKTLAAILNAYPDLEGAIVAYLKEGMK